MRFVVLLHLIGVFFLKSVVSFLSRGVLVKSPKRFSSELQADIFGMGAPEMVIVGIVFVLVYGPGKVKNQLKDNNGSSENGDNKLEGWKAEQQEKISSMLENAKIQREKRAWRRVASLVEKNDLDIIDKLADLEEASESNLS